MIAADHGASGWRRRELVGAASASVLAAVGGPFRAVPALAQSDPPRGQERDPRRLRIGYSEVSPDGRRPLRAITVDGSVPGPELRLEEGEWFRVVLANGLPDQATTIHWHGLLVPSAMDGVPGLSMTPVPPQQLFLYEFPVRQSGTYWYHSHVGLQEQAALYGPLVIEPKHEPLRYDRDHVVMLGDWLHRDPSAALAELQGKSKPGGTAMAGMDMGGGAGAATAMPAVAVAGSAGAMDMAKPDLSDLAYDAFLLNGRGNDDPWTAVAKPGERVRLRLINAGASTFFKFRVDGLPLTVVHADGNAVRPVTVDWLLVGMAETYDLLVEIGRSGSFTIRAEAQDGSGQALGVLHTPDVRPRADAARPQWTGRQLSYADLVADTPTTLPLGPPRGYALALTGDMARYVWSIDGQVYPNADPLTVRAGERIEVSMVNRTGMWHPMHLHGHFFRLLDTGVDPDHAPLKHTVSLPPGGTARIEFLADNPGRWFFHCHNLYHLEAGMAREWVYTV